jgi:lipopolysaccharide transport system ATP-binding protein
MSSDYAIRIQGLGKCYQIYEKPRDRLLQMLARGRKNYFKEFWALRDVSFSIGRGETVGIIGRNGSGKSTLLQMICGTVSPTAGIVDTAGRVAALLELGAGFNVEFTGRENVLLNASILGFPVEAMSQRMNDVLAFSELGQFIDQPVKTYSSGMYARLAFSIAIHVDPEILVVDEALAVGDARFVAKCMRRIRDMQSAGVTVLFVSHDTSAVRTLCERALWLDNGELVADGDVFPVTGKYMEYMFKDDDAAARIVRPGLPPTLPAPGESGAAPAAPAPQGGSGDAPGAAAHGIDARPATHWGSHKGLIRAASVCDSQGIRRDVHQWASDLHVVIDLAVPAEIPREHLSVAFSIKDLKGSDLIVSTTRDGDIRQLPSGTDFRVRFRLPNMLVAGKYLLVAAVENRAYREIHYYEYVEGAHYFSSVANQNFFGIFQPAIGQSVEVGE